MKKIRSFIIAAALVITMLISSCSDPITTVDNAISPEGQNCGALVC